MQPYRIAGIDVSKNKLDVWAHEHHRCEGYDEASLGRLVEAFETGGIDTVAMEATGGLHRKAANYFYRMGFRVYVLNPLSVYHSAQALGLTSKTDRLDARAIHRHVEQNHDKLRLYKPPSPTAQLLARLTARRRDLAKMAAQEKCRIQQAACPEEEESCARIIRVLEAEQADLSREIERLLKSDEQFRRRCKIIHSMPGLGPASAAILVADLPELGQVGRKTISALAGVAPIANDSGKRQGKRGIKGGRAELRQALWMPTLTAARCNPVIRKHYNKLVEQGKPHKVALVACIRKMLTILNAMIRDDRLWEPATA